MPNTKVAYTHIRDDLHRKIITGRLLPGTTLQSATSIAGQYGVSRATAERALDELERAGLLTRRRGRGTTVINGVSDEFPLPELTSLTEDMRRMGRVPSSRLLSSGEQPAPDKVADSLDIQPGTPVLLIKRLRSGDGIPVALHRQYLAPALVARIPSIHDVDWTNTSSYEFIESHLGSTFATGEQRLSAKGADQEEAEALGISPGAPILFIERRTRDPFGTPVEYIEMSNVSDRYYYSALLRRAQRSS